LGEVYCDARKAKEVLDWEARISIEESVRNGVMFYESRNINQGN
jgi:nucleoside-diphosphate-sugar epimerase